MNTFFGLLVLLAMVAGGYFLVKLIICVLKGGDKKFYSKRLAIAVVVFLIGGIGAAATQSPERKAANEAQRQVQEQKKQQQLAEKKAKEEADKKALEEQKALEEEARAAAEARRNTPEGKIEDKLREYVKGYDETTIDSITLNPDLGTEKDGDYVALVRLTWNRKNSGKMSREMLEMFSSDMAAKAYEDLPDVQELAVFWTVPYLNGSAKVSFERTSGGMKFTDKVFDKGFNE
ncbi:hypothetical protein SELR_pSRC500110 (plasmid) [Selenomonas ruminantium subsp. lactilytica TAM6421]|uniref:Uncharacterized protein n=1 Tax=Selenomonas ruminantium subsp. lactilytica (strain NBRC 103574 / TAM6421) TaxID=927704 RepID=I0GWP8_SELRL|nr:hypothetical protein [Selenomonas ruminantium]BAL85185.1 hypothetical protein SELR_pSRC500110 [Selenomonas ruminantium subsp. lactilytica TAM6421]